MKDEMLRKLSFKAVRFLKKNSSTILTVVGAVGVVGTAVTAVKATPKALDILAEAEEAKGEELTKFEKVKVAGPVYIPSILIGTATIACIFGANVLNKRQQAALMSAYALLDNSYKEYKNKVKDIYGDEVDAYIRKEIVKDHIKDVELSVEDTILFYDEYSNRYFESTWEKVKDAEYEINRRISQNSGAYLNEFYELLGIEQPEYGDYLGWSQGEMMETAWNPWLDFFHDKVEMEDGLECVIIAMGYEPTYDFDNY